jgi:hypothetical protein
MSATCRYGTLGVLLRNGARMYRMERSAVEQKPGREPGTRRNHALREGGSRTTNSNEIKTARTNEPSSRAPVATRAAWCRSPWRVPAKDASGKHCRARSSTHLEVPGSVTLVPAPRARELFVRPPPANLLAVSELAEVDANGGDVGRLEMQAYVVENLVTRRAPRGILVDPDQHDLSRDRRVGMGGEEMKEAVVGIDPTHGAVPR